MIHIYREGKTHNFKGIECEIKRVEFEEAFKYEAQGWVLDPKDLNKKTTTKKKPQPKAK